MHFKVPLSSIVCHWNSPLCTSSSYIQDSHTSTPKRDHPRLPHCPTVAALSEPAICIQTLFNWVGHWAFCKQSWFGVCCRDARNLSASTFFSCFHAAGLLGHLLSLGWSSNRQQLSALLELRALELVQGAAVRPAVHAAHFFVPSYSRRGSDTSGSTIDQNESSAASTRLQESGLEGGIADGRGKKYKRIPPTSQHMAWDYRGEWILVLDAINS